MPQRLEAQDIISGTVHGNKLEYLDTSMKQSLSVSSTIVSSAHHSGFNLVDLNLIFPSRLLC
jgi:hypothetical protein